VRSRTCRLGRCGIRGHAGLSPAGTGSRPAVIMRLFAPVHACRCCGLPPLVKVPRAHRLWVFINRQSRHRITTGFTYDKCSAYLLTVTVRRVDNYRFFFYTQGADRSIPGEGPVMPTGRRHDPQPFPTARTGYAPFYTSNPHGRAQQAGTSSVSPPRAASDVMNGTARHLTLTRLPLARAWGMRTVMLMEPV
jgi:hypothetical protein